MYLQGEFLTKIIKFFSQFLSRKIIKIQQKKQKKKKKHFKIIIYSYLHKL